MKMRELPLPYLAALLLLVAASLLALVTWFYPSIFVFVLGNVAALFTLLVFGVLGGAFVGMIAAHRILAHNDFTSFERSVLTALQDLREATQRLERTENELLDRIREMEKRRGP